MKRKNKKGWVKMVEVFISIMLLSASMVLLLNQNFFTGQTINEIDDQIKNIVIVVQKDETTRGEILDASLPTVWEDFESSGLSSTYSEITSRTPVNLDCEAMVCALNEDCLPANPPEDRDIYSRRAYISADLDTYSPRQIKVFCWKKVR
jgi:hypothetical protein